MSTMEKILQKIRGDSLDSGDEDQPDVQKGDLSKLSLKELRELKQEIHSFVSRQEPSSSHRPNGSMPVFRRENKNRPRELSSKIKPKRDPIPKKFRKRDPRFEESSGPLDENIFEQNYQFLDEMREKEKRIIKKKMKKEKDEEKKEKIKNLMSQLDNQEKSNEQKGEALRLTQKIRKEQFEKTGRTHVSKSQLKMAQAVEKFKKLKKSGKLDKYLEKKRKKNASKERKKLDILQ